MDETHLWVISYNWLACCPAEYYIRADRRLLHHQDDAGDEHHERDAGQYDPQKVSVVHTPCSRQISKTPSVDGRNH